MALTTARLPPLPGSRRARARRLIHQRRRLGYLLLGTALVALFLLFTLPNLARADSGPTLAYALFGVFISLGTWTLLLRAASARRGKARWIAMAALVVGALLVGTQVYAYRVFNAYIDELALRSINALSRSIAGVARRQLSSILLTFLPLELVAVALPFLLQQLLRTKRGQALRSLVAAFGLMATGLVVFPTIFPVNYALPPDLLLAVSLRRSPPLLHKENRFLLSRPHRRNADTLPPLVAAPRRRRNVLVLLNESLRADETCIAFDPTCATTPEVNAATPGRLPLLQLRSLDSTTAISLGVLFTGLPVSATDTELHTMPLVFEYALAAKWSAVYETSQNMLFEGSGDWLEGVPFTHFASGLDFDPSASPEAGADDALTLADATKTLATVPEPFFALVQLANTHLPYRVDVNDAPYQPTSEVSTPATAERFRNRYRNAVHHQDRLLGAFLRSLRASPAGERTVVVYLSDHGESFFEKGLGYHASSLFEGEVHIPGWVDAPPGTLTEKEVAALHARETTPLTILDILPTVLDLIGLRGQPEVAAYETRMPGQSLLDPAWQPEGPTLLTNCSSIWTCALMNVGAIDGQRKYFARSPDEPHCFDVIQDPGENHDLGVGACASLIHFSEPFRREREEKNIQKLPPREPAHEVDR